MEMAYTLLILKKICTMLVCCTIVRMELGLEKKDQPLKTGKGPNIKDSWNPEKIPRWTTVPNGF